MWKLGRTLGRCQDHTEQKFVEGIQKPVEECCRSAVLNLLGPSNHLENFVKKQWVYGLEVGKDTETAKVTSWNELNSK